MSEERTKRRGRREERANRDWWQASAARTRARREALAARWVELAPLAEAWAAVVALVERRTAAWVKVLAAAAGSVPATDEGRAALAWADDPRPPWIRRAEFELPPVLRPLHERLEVEMEVAPASDRLDEVLAGPEPLTSLPVATSVAAARALYRRESAKTKTLEAALLTGYARRERVVEVIADAEARWSRAWWTTWPIRCAGVAGDPMAARGLALSLHGEATGILRRALDAFRPAVARRPAPKAKRRPKRARASAAPRRRRRRA
jgi:hypothetical protein